MGTSGAYGGSGTKPWEQAHDAYHTAGEASSGPSDGQVDAFVKAFMNALARQTGPSPSTGYSLASLRPRRASGAGSGGGGSTSSAGGGGGRNLGRQAARGAAGVAGAGALRLGDRAALRELGLDLDQLDRLSSPLAKCTYIVDTLLGAPNHPDEVALRAATLRTSVEILKSDQPLSPAQQIQLFLQHLAYEQVLVELTSQRRAETLTPQRAKQIEDKAKKYLRTSVATMPVPKSSTMSVQSFVTAAGKLAEKVLAVFKIKGRA